MLNLHAELLGLGLSPRTVVVYARTIMSAQAWFSVAGWNLNRATGAQVATYVETLPLTWSSRTLARIALCHWWELVDHPAPPRKAFRIPPKPAMVCRAVDEDDARILAKAARARQDRKGVAVLLGLYQAMRREEIATARWDAIDRPDAGWVTILGKGAKTRVVPLHPVVVEALALLPREAPWVFVGYRDSHVSPATVWGWVRQVAEEAGCGRLATHILRHTALASVNDRTGDLRTTQHFAGHAKPETTSGYTRASRHRLLAAVAALNY